MKGSAWGLEGFRSAVCGGRPRERSGYSDRVGARASRADGRVRVARRGTGVLARRWMGPRIG